MHTVSASADLKTATFYMLLFWLKVIGKHYLIFVLKNDNFSIWWNVYISQSITPSRVVVSSILHRFTKTKVSLYFIKKFVYSAYSRYYGIFRRQLSLLCKTRSLRIFILGQYKWVFFQYVRQKILEGITFKVSVVFWWIRLSADALNSISFGISSKFKEWNCFLFSLKLSFVHFANNSLISGFVLQIFLTHTIIWKGNKCNSSLFVILWFGLQSVSVSVQLYGFTTGTFTKCFEKKARWELYKDAVCCFE